MFSELEASFKMYLESLTDCIDELNPETLTSDKYISELERMFEDCPGLNVFNERHFMIQHIPLVKAKFYMSLSDTTKATEAWNLWKVYDAA